MEKMDYESCVNIMTEYIDEARAVINHVANELEGLSKSKLVHPLMTSHIETLETLCNAALTILVRADAVSEAAD